MNGLTWFYTLGSDSSGFNPTTSTTTLGPTTTTTSAPTTTTTTPSGTIRSTGMLFEITVDDKTYQFAHTSDGPMGIKTAGKTIKISLSGTGAFGIKTPLGTKKLA
jgi:hypothetical protein